MSCHFSPLGRSSALLFLLSVVLSQFFGTTAVFAQAVSPQDEYEPNPRQLMVDPECLLTREETLQKIRTELSPIYKCANLPIGKKLCCKKAAAKSETGCTGIRDQVRSCCDQAFYDQSKPWRDWICERVVAYKAPSLVQYCQEQRTNALKSAGCTSY